jgi:YHS domain-containing protein
MKQLIVVISLFWGLSAFAGNTSNVNKAGVILDGFDAVSYFQSDKPVKGDSKFQVKQGDAIYWFSSDDHKKEFLKNPKKYEPQFGGWCAYAVATSKEKVDVDPKSFVIQDGRLLLFYNGIWADTRKKWTATKDKDPKTFLKDADSNWPAVINKEP